MSGFQFWYTFFLSFRRNVSSEAETSSLSPSLSLRSISFFTRCLARDALMPCAIIIANFVPSWPVKSSSSASFSTSSFSNSSSFSPSLFFFVTASIFSTISSCVKDCIASNSSHIFSDIASVVVNSSSLSSSLSSSSSSMETIIISSSE